LARYCKMSAELPEHVRESCGMALAHSENSAGFKHDLATHLQQVAELASKFAEKFGAGDLGRWVGWWHDLGKFHPDFQAYLSAPTAPHGPDHKGAGVNPAL